MTNTYERLTKLKQRLRATMQASQSQENLCDAIRFTMDNYCGDDNDRVTAATENIHVQFKNFDGEWFVPNKCDTARRILFIHGGGWMSGSVNTHRHLIAEIAVQSSCPVLAINYRLAPENKYPAGLNDCIEAYQTICNGGPIQKRSKGKTSTEKNEATEIIIVGDSCGGNLSTVCTLHMIENKLRIPDKLILLSPSLDNSNRAEEPKGVSDEVVSMEGMEQVAAAYLEADSLQLRELQNISPLKIENSILGQFPSTLLQVGSEEYFRDETVNFAKRLWELGKTTKLSVWPHMPHDFQLFAKELAEAREAIREICLFITPE